MFRLKKIAQKNHKAFMLIEALTFLFIFTVVSVTFYATWSTSTRYILLSKNKLAASALANEKMEIVRNLAFDDIALTTSDPAGNLVESEDVARSGRTFNIATQIRFEDDPFDGTLGGTPNDADFIDYKFVKITVSWDGGAEKVVASSRFVPAGIEQSDPTRGILVINVSSDKAGGAFVSEANVRIRNADTGFDETHNTDAFGRLMMVGLRESHKKYEITVSKSGYETVSTVAPYPDGPYNPPTHENASVVATAVSTMSIFQNQLASLAIKTVDYLGDEVGNINYHLNGGRELGVDPILEAPDNIVFSLNSDDETNSSGEKDYGEINPGQYGITLTEAGYKIVGTNLGKNFVLDPGASEILTVKVAPENMTSLLVKVFKDDNVTAISGASVHLTNVAGYDATFTTGVDGEVFFPNATDPLFVSGVYDISVSATDYENHTGQVTLTANELKEEQISLIAS